MKNINFFGPGNTETVFPANLNAFLQLIEKYKCKIVSLEENPPKVTYVLPQTTSSS